MTVRRFDNPLHHLLSVLAKSSMVPDSQDRVAIEHAANIVARLLPDARVLVTGPDQLTDPVTAELLDISEEWSHLYDTLAVLQDRTEDLARQLRKGKS